MIRPICVIYFPDNYSFYASGRNLEPMHLMKELNMWDAEGILAEKDMDRFGGYMYWCFTKYGIDAPEFQVFHPKDFTEANYEELKQFVMTKINEIINVSANGE